MRMSKKAWLLLPLGLVPPIASLWEGRYLIAALYCLFLLWLLHPSGASDCRAQLRSIGTGVARLTTFSKVVFGVGVALSIWILYTRT